MTHKFNGNCSHDYLSSEEEEEFDTCFGYITKAAYITKWKVILFNFSRAWLPEFEETAWKYRYNFDTVSKLLHLKP